MIFDLILICLLVVVTTWGIILHYEREEIRRQAKWLLQRQRYTSQCLFEYLNGENKPIQYACNLLTDLSLSNQMLADKIGIKIDV